jgi:hypothetical protein
MSHVGEEVVPSWVSLFMAGAFDLTTAYNGLDRCFLFLSLFKMSSFLSSVPVDAAVSFRLDVKARELLERQIPLFNKFSYRHPLLWCVDTSTQKIIRPSGVFKHSDTYPGFMKLQTFHKGSFMNEFKLGLDSDEFNKMILNAFYSDPPSIQDIKVPKVPVDKLKWMLKCVVNSIPETLEKDYWTEYLQMQDDWVSLQKFANIGFVFYSQSMTSKQISDSISELGIAFDSTLVDDCIQWFRDVNEFPRLLFIKREFRNIRYSLSPLCIPKEGCKDVTLDVYIWQEISILFKFLVWLRHIKNEPEYAASYAKENMDNKRGFIKRKCIQVFFEQDPRVSSILFQLDDWTDNMQHAYEYIHDYTGEPSELERFRAHMPVHEEHIIHKQMESGDENTKAVNENGRHRDGRMNNMYGLNCLRAVYSKRGDRCDHQDDVFQKCFVVVKQENVEVETESVHEDLDVKMEAESVHEDLDVKMEAESVHEDSDVMEMDAESETDSMSEEDVNELQQAQITPGMCFENVRIKQRNGKIMLKMRKYTMLSRVNAKKRERKNLFGGKYISMESCWNSYYRRNKAK